MSNYESRKVLSCQFNIDTACVELKLSDGATLSIDCAAVEDELEVNRFQQSELDYLIYNEIYLPRMIQFNFATAA